MNNKKKKLTSLLLTMCTLLSACSLSIGPIKLIEPVETMKETEVNLQDYPDFDFKETKDIVYLKPSKSVYETPNLEKSKFDAEDISAATALFKDKDKGVYYIKLDKDKVEGFVRDQDLLFEKSKEEENEETSTKEEETTPEETTIEEATTTTTEEPTTTTTTEETTTTTTKASTTTTTTKATTKAATTEAEINEDDKIYYPASPDDIEFNEGVAFAIVNKEAEVIISDTVYTTFVVGGDEMFNLNKGDKVKIISIGTNNFCRIEKNGQVGYIKTKSLRYV